MSKNNKPKVKQQYTSVAGSGKQYVIQLVWFLAAVWAIYVGYRFFQRSPFPLLIILKTILPDTLVFPSLIVLKDDFVGFFWTLLLLMNAYFWGRLVLCRWVKEGAPSLAILSFSLALGYGIIAYLILAMGMLGWLYSGLIKGFVIGVSLLAIFFIFKRDERELLRGAFQEFKQVFFESGISKVLGIFLCFVLLTDFIMAFVPEIFYDALVYHLGAPNYYLIQHKLMPLDLLPAKFPFTLQMVNLVGLALKDEIVTKLTHFLMLLMIVCTMISLGVQTNKKLWGLISALIFCTIPTVQFNVWTSGVDMGVCLFGFSAAICFFYALDQDSRFNSWLTLSAIFTGLAVASKYTVIYIPLTITLTLLCMILLKRVFIKKAILPFFAFGVISFLILLPWLIKNYFETGNPVYPFLSTFFGGEVLEPFRYVNLRNENKGITPESFWGVFKMIWDICINERSSLTYQGPLFLGLFPFFILALWRDRPKWLLSFCVYGLIFIVMGLFMTRLTRYLLPGITVLACLIAFGVFSFINDRSYFVRLGTLFSLAFLLYLQVSSAYIGIAGSIKPEKVLFGQESRFDFASRYAPGWNPTPPHQMYKYIEKNLEKTDKVLLVGDEMAYPIKVNHYYSGVYDRGPLLRICNESQSGQEVAQKLFSQGFTHLIVNVHSGYRTAGYGIFKWTPEGFARFCAFWEQFISLEHVEYVGDAVNKTSPILLLKIHPNGRLAGSSPVQNVIAPAFEKFEFPRMNIKTNDEVFDFYKRLQAIEPGVVYFGNRMKTIENK